MKFDAQKIIDEHGGKCKTRDGRDAVIYAVYDSSYHYPIHGAYACHGGAMMICGQWVADGGHRLAPHESDRDLIMPRTLVAEWYVNADPETGDSSAKYDPPIGQLGDMDGWLCIHTRLYSDNTVESEVVE